MIEDPNASNRIYDAQAITPSDTVENKWDALYIGTGGHVVVRLPNKTTTVTFSNAQTGSILPMAVDYVYSTGTAAQNIVGLKILDIPR